MNILCLIGIHKLERTVSPGYVGAAYCKRCGKEHPGYKIPQPKKRPK